MSHPLAQPLAGHGAEPRTPGPATSASPKATLLRPPGWQQWWRSTSSFPLRHRCRDRPGPGRGGGRRKACSASTALRSLSRHRAAAAWPPSKPRSHPLAQTTTAAMSPATAWGGGKTKTSGVVAEGSTSLHRPHCPHTARLRSQGVPCLVVLLLSPLVCSWPAPAFPTTPPPFRFWGSGLSSCP